MYDSFGHHSANMWMCYLGSCVAGYTGAGRSAAGSDSQELQEGLTMKLLRLFPFCAEALKQWHSASFSSRSLRWVFYKELLPSLGTYRPNSVMGC